MIAFYVFSNFLLIHAAVIKQAYFPEETADLIVRSDNSSLSRELVKEYERSGIFRKVHKIPCPHHLRPENGKYGRIPGLRKITFYWDHNRYNNRILEQTVRKQKYDKIFLPYLSNHIQDVALYLVKQNPEIQLIFYDEGLVHYTRPISQILGHFETKKRNWKEIISDSIGEEFFLRQVRPRARPSIYLHIPKRDIIDPWFKEVYLLPQVSQYPQCLAPLEKIGQRLDEYNVAHYSRRMAVYVSGPYSILSNKRLQSCAAMEEDYPTFQSMYHIIGASNCILKPHPISKLVVKHLGKDFEEEGLYVDRHLYLFETMFLVAENSEDLILISRYSAALFNAKFWFDMEPYIIYTYRLYPSYESDQDYTMDQFIQEAKQTYKDPSRVMIPNSMEEYEEMLSQTRLKILNKRCHYNFYEMEA